MEGLCTPLPVPSQLKADLTGWWNERVTALSLSVISVTWVE